MTRRVPRPLSSLLYLRRSPRRVLPAIAVQALVTALVLAVAVPLTGWEATAEAHLRPLRAYTGVLPNARQGFDDGLAAVLDANPALERRLPAVAVWIDTPGVVGKQNSAFVAVPRGEMEEYLRRSGARLVEGRLPDPGSDGAVVHADVARARGFAIGTVFGALADRDDSTPGKFTVVGIVDGPGRVNVFDLAYATRAGGVLARTHSFQIVYAKEGRKAESDRWLAEARDAEGVLAFRVRDEAHYRAEIDAEMRQLRLILGAIQGAIAVVVVLVTALFHLIAFQARADEFALLLAVGRTRRRLVGKTTAETALSSLVALVLGLAVGWGWLATWQATVLRPRAIHVDLFEPFAVGLAAALPLVAAAASAGVLALRLRRVDPVAVIQRRNA